MTDDALIFCTYCGDPVYDQPEPAHPCCVFWDKQTPGRPCQGCAESKRARLTRRERRKGAA